MSLFSGSSHDLHPRRVLTGPLQVQGRGQVSVAGGAPRGVAPPHRPVGSAARSEARHTAADKRPIREKELRHDLGTRAC